MAITIDGTKKTAIVKFKQIQSAESCYKNSREADKITGKRRSILGEKQPDAQVVYVIPEISLED